MSNDDWVKLHKEMDIYFRLLYWAHNEDMIDQYYTQRGMDLLEACDRIEELEKTNADLMQTLQQEYERSRQYQTALSNITKMTMCMATSYNDLAQKQKDLAIDALAKDI